MTILTLTAPPAADLAEALDRFERQFVYPLGPGRTFRISHGRDYLPFFQAMGDARVLVAMQHGAVLGTLAIVTRRLLTEGGKTAAAPAQQAARPVHYLCDLKVSPESRGGVVLAALFRRAGQLVRASGTHACYAVVMEGTGRLPVEYTGRLGVPPFEQVGRIVVLRLTPRAGGLSPTELRSVDEHEFTALRQQAVSMSPPGVAIFPHDALKSGSSLRSRLAPLRWCNETGSAGGVVEDTLLGKRLLVGDSDELVSAHLSRLWWQPGRGAEGARFLENVAIRMAKQGYPAVFAAIPEDCLAELRPHLEQVDCIEAPARVYGYQVPANADWWIDTAEI